MSVHLSDRSKELLGIEDTEGSLPLNPLKMGSVPPPEKKFANPNKKKHRKHGKIRKEPEAFAEAPRTSPGR